MIHTKLLASQTQVFGRIRDNHEARAPRYLAKAYDNYQDVFLQMGIMNLKLRSVSAH